MKQPAIAIKYRKHKNTPTCRATGVSAILAAAVCASLLFTACAPPSFAPSKHITVVAREDGSGTKAAFMDLIGLKGKIDPVNVIIQTGTAGVLAEVRSNPGAIAYDSLGFVTADVKTLKVDGAAATVENIKNGAYKIARPFSVVYKESTVSKPEDKAFLDFLQSGDAQKIITDSGYVPLNDDAPPYTVDGRLSGGVDVSGSTSVQPLMIKLATAFEKLQPNMTVNVSGGGSGTGYKNAESGVSTFGMISEEFAREKAPSCTSYTICKDGIAVIVNKENTFDTITMEQLKRIYDDDAGANAITQWSQIK